MALTDEEQQLFDFAKGSLPPWVRDRDEFLTAAAKQFGSVRELVAYLFGQALITSSTGPGSDTPDWLAQHARDRGSSRQAGEGDAALQQRLRLIPDALTRQALLDAANGILAAAGVAGSAALVELPRDGAWLGPSMPFSGTGGTFTQAASTTRFTPAELPWLAEATAYGPIGYQLVVSGAIDSGNNGTRTVTGFDGDAVVVTNSSGVARTDAGVSWTVQRTDDLGNVTDGFARAYADRGYRTSATRPTMLIMILPFGTTAGTAASIDASIRAKKAGGVALVIERRMVP